MFWRFGFNSGSGIESLLDKEDVALENILDEDDLLQECKTQNTRLIEYFQRLDVLQRLLSYAIDDAAEDEKLQKYSHLATEVLCSDIWSIVETCLNEQTQLMVPFWESIFERSTADMERNVIPAAHFAKINGNFLNKKPGELLQFIRTQSYVVERFVYHIECQPLLELLTRMIQTDGQLGTEGVIEWLSTQHFLDRLLALLDPKTSPDIHLVAADLLKAILAMTTPSPGEGMQQANVSNCFARDLATKAAFSKLVGYVMLDFSVDRNVASKSSPDLPEFESMISSVNQATSVIIELIRKNNSDYFEPFLFHSLRNRMIQVQQEMHTQPDLCRQAMEDAFHEMTEKMGIVNMGIVLQEMGDRLEPIVGYLKAPRSADGPKPSSLGDTMPLTTERFRLIELIAELIHCSNMAILNRSHKHDHLYDSEGHLQGGLAALDELAYVISLPDGDASQSGPQTEDDVLDRRTPSLEFPVSGTYRSQSSRSSLSSDEDTLSSDEDEAAMEEIMMMSAESPSPGASLSSSPETPLHGNLSSSLPPSSANEAILNSINASSQSLENFPMHPGDTMKETILKCNTFTVLLDLFFEFPWNNFLHSAVYDILHQVFTGPFDSGLNKEMAISILRDSKLMQRILEMQELNDKESAKPNGLRQGYMGHLTLISEDVISALSRFTSSDLTLLMPSIPSGWNAYVEGKYEETRKRDAISLGGGKPVVSNGTAGRWKVDEAEPNTLTLEDKPEGEFRRTGKLTRESSADFGPPMDNFEDDEFLQNSDDDEYEGWLSRPSTFTLNAPPALGNRQDNNSGPSRKPLSSGFDDAFGSTSPTSNAIDLGFPSPADDDGFGAFSGSDHSAGNSSLGDDFDDSFGDDFGDFQAASTTSDEDDGQMTPTADSWTFAAEEEDELSSRLSNVDVSSKPARDKS